jgi:fructose-1,6-bisphosphatase I / sedoheptulose-1,7-bisphosphatase
VARGPLNGAHGSNATHNVQGETQQKLDVIANDIMLRSCEWGASSPAWCPRNCPSPT